jgi:hypothetical protein
VAPLRLASRIGRAVVIAAVLTTALVYMSDDMVNVAIPSLAKDRGGTVTDVQWIVDSAGRAHADGLRSTSSSP